MPEIPHGNEAFSFWTHVAGAALALVGLVVLVREAEGAREMAAVAIYGATMVLLFASSALHHTFPRAPPVVKTRLRRLDHSAIFLFIAGTYTPVCVIAFEPRVGLPVLGLVWALALAGVVRKVAFAFGSRRVDAALYVALGWAALLVAKPVYDRFTAQGLALLVAGGLLYSLGAVVYARGRPDPWPRVVGFHGLWHLFVLAAAGSHFAFVLAHVLR